MSTFTRLTGSQKLITDCRRLHSWRTIDVSLKWFTFTNLFVRLYNSFLCRASRPVLGTPRFRGKHGDLPRAQYMSVFISQNNKTNVTKNNSCFTFVNYFTNKYCVIFYLDDYGNWRFLVLMILHTLRPGADQSSKADCGKSAFAKTCSYVLSFVKDTTGAHQSSKNQICFRARFGTF